jgi:hypothetical protein
LRSSSDCTLLRALGDQMRTKIAAGEACPTGDQNTHLQVHSTYFAVRSRCQTCSQIPDRDLREAAAQADRKRDLKSTIG